MYSFYCKCMSISQQHMLQDIGSNEPLIFCTHDGQHACAPINSCNLFPSLSLFIQLVPL